MVLDMRKLYEGCIGWSWACEKCMTCASDGAGHGDGYNYNYIIYITEII